MECFLRLRVYASTCVYLRLRVLRLDSAYGRSQYLRRADDRPKKVIKYEQIQN